MQLFRHFNGTLAKKKESRRRNLNFHLPLMVPLAELTALTSTSLTVETKVLLTVRSTTVAPWSVIFG